MTKVLNLKNKNINNLIMSYIQGNLNTNNLIEETKIEVLDYLKSQLNEEKLKIKELKKRDPLYKLIRKSNKVNETPEIVKNLRNFLPTLAFNKNGGFYNIVGGAGSGKTSFLMKLVKILIHLGYQEKDISVFIVGEREEDTNGMWKHNFKNIHIVDLSLSGLLPDDLNRLLKKEIKLEVNRTSKVVIFDSITKSLNAIQYDPLVDALTKGLATGGVNMSAMTYFTSIISTLLRCTYDQNNNLLIKNKLLITTSLDSISNKGNTLIKEEVESVSLGELFLNKEVGGVDFKKSYTRYNNLICSEEVLKNIEDIKENYSNKSLNDFFKEQYNKI